jgi:hypothetical protein
MLMLMMVVVVRIKRGEGGGEGAEAQATKRRGIRKEKMMPHFLEGLDDKSYLLPVCVCVCVKMGRILQEGRRVGKFCQLTLLELFLSLASCPFLLPVPFFNYLVSL